MDIDPIKIVKYGAEYGYCPHCGTNRQWVWNFMDTNLKSLIQKSSNLSNLLHHTEINSGIGRYAYCNNCRGIVVYDSTATLIYPDISRLPLKEAHPYLKTYPKAEALFKESIGVAPFSPRASLTLARMCLECVVKEILTTQGKTIKNELVDNIQTLEDGGLLSKKLCSTLGTLRIIGNKAIHNLALIGAESDITNDDTVLVWNVIDRILTAIQENEELEQLKAKAKQVEPPNSKQ